MSIKRLKTEEEIKESLGDKKPSLTISLYDMPSDNPDTLSVAMRVDFPKGDPPASPADLSISQRVGLSMVQEMQEYLTRVDAAFEEEHAEDSASVFEIKDEIDQKLAELGINPTNYSKEKH